VVQTLREAIRAETPPPDDYERFRLHPLASWIETTFGVRAEAGAGRLIRQAPQRLQGADSAAEELARLTTTDPLRCAEVLRQYLLRGSAPQSRTCAQDKQSGKP
jgi:hypothetical protein